MMLMNSIITLTFASDLKSVCLDLLFSFCVDSLLSEFQSHCWA